jgi:hypothetical protein
MIRQLAMPILLMCASLVGCGVARVDISPAPGQTLSLDRTKPLSTGRDEVGYVFAIVDDRVLVEISNSSTSKLELTDASAIVDAADRSHAIDPFTIEPGQTRKLLIPPRVKSQPIDRTDDTLPDDGLHTIAGHPIEAYATREPKFDWPVGRVVSLRLVFSRDGQNLVHEMTLTRK